ncbi:response regulator transcription factor [Protaetiibacter larvae]|uniref:Helix-turn-helix transcriptional regulator n=1 Tax=Protaetiibacter larvae TaxID=2592654 RepID=A0A5C1Y8D8_9MICO|nr:helix-turn-helix transcriptional regulator [Protaetiibacter larvae]QEO09495.1 helix-turn-helix transcriptional regulator [Protaetiibacter larvae]
MLKDVAAARARGDIDVLSRAGLGLEDFLTEAVDSVHRAVPWVAACISTQDPATHILTSARKYGALEGRNEHDGLWARLEYGGDDPTNFLSLYATGRTAVAMQLATDGGIERSVRMGQLMRPHYDFWDETRMIFADGDTYWGTMSLFRGSDEAAFDPVEVGWLQSLAPLLARGVRAGLVAGSVADARSPSAGVSLTIVDGSDTVTQISPGAERRLAQLLTDERSAHPMSMIAALAGAARRYGRGELPTPPRVRVRTADGEWLLIQASPLSGADAGAVAIMIEDAAPVDVAGVLLAALELTDREREVLRLILRGADTKTIAAELFLSPYTVQDHCKAIFEKVGVRSRRELIAQLMHHPGDAVHGDDAPSS